MVKPWYVTMAGSGSLADIKEALGHLIPYIRGWVITYHGERDDPEALYLELNKGEGRIIYLPYSGRHSHSRNTYLWCGPIKDGDWCLQADILEHVPISFAEQMPSFILDLQARGVNAAFYHSKPFLYRYHESLEFTGSPHEGLRRHDGLMRSVELKEAFPDESKIRLNVRPLKRDNQHFVKHYVSYYLLPWGSNHLMLGADKAQAAGISFETRERRRLAFRDYVRNVLRLPLKADAIKAYMTGGEVTPEFKTFVNEEKILNDAWRAWVLGQTNLLDNHDHSDKIVLT